MRYLNNQTQEKLPYIQNVHICPFLFKEQN